MKKIVVIYIAYQDEGINSSQAKVSTECCHTPVSQVQSHRVLVLKEDRSGESEPYRGPAC